MSKCLKKMEVNIKNSHYINIYNYREKNTKSISQSIEYL